MLQEAPDDAAHADVLSQLAGQHARAPHDQIDLRPRIARAQQRLDQGLVGQRIHLGHHAPAQATPGGLAHRFDLGQHLLVQREGRKQHALHARQAAVAGQMHKQTIHVGRQARVGGQVADIGVQRRRARVVVARRQMAIAAQLAPFAPRDQQHLGMRLQAHHAIDHLGARTLEPLCPVDVGLFVKACLQLDHRRDFLAAPLRLDEQIHHPAVVASAVDGLLDGEHLRVLHGLAQEVDDAVKAFKRQVAHHVALLQPRHHGFALAQRRRVAGLVGHELQIAPVGQINQLLQPHQVDRPLHPKERFRRQLELVQQKGRQLIRAGR